MILHLKQRQQVGSPPSLCPPRSCSTQWCSLPLWPHPGASMGRLQQQSGGRTLPGSSLFLLELESAPANMANLRCSGSFHPCHLLDCSPWLLIRYLLCPSLGQSLGGFFLSPLFLGGVPKINFNYPRPAEIPLTTPPALLRACCSSSWM